MLIRYQDRRIVDYGVFATDPSYYDEIKAVESSVSQTDISGNVPATMTMVLEDGTVLRTKKFVAEDSYNQSFRIVDRDIYEIASKMIANEKHYGDILDIALRYDNSNRFCWYLTIIFYDPFDGFSDGIISFDVESVYWLPDK